MPKVPPALSQAVHARFEQAVSRRMRKAAAEQRLDRRSTYVLPTGYGVFFALMLYVMLLGAINYSNSMAFMLTFLLAGIALVGMLYTYRNLASLHVAAGQAQPVFAGGRAEFPLFLQSGDPGGVWRIGVGLNRRELTIIDVPAGGTARATVSVPAPRRGRLTLDRVRLQTRFPLGLFQVWSWLAFSAGTLVYPEPAGGRRLRRSAPAGEGLRVTRAAGQDDFAGIRRYQPGDPPTRIAWKALAQSNELLTKQFSEAAGEAIWLDWDALEGLDVEARLSQLCQWVLELHHRDARYGLRLPGGVIPPGAGERHRAACLEALALF